MSNAADAYYWLVIGRILFDDEDTVYPTDLPCTRDEALAAFHRELNDQDPERYGRNGAIVLYTLRSTEPIEFDD